MVDETEQVPGIVSRLRDQRATVSGRTEGYYAFCDYFANVLEGIGPKGCPGGASVTRMLKPADFHSIYQLAQLSYGLDRGTKRPIEGDQIELVLSGDMIPPQPAEVAKAITSGDFAAAVELAALGSLTN